MTHLNRRTATVAILAIIALVGVAASLLQKQEPKKYLLQLKWVYNASFAGDLVAKDKGFWSARGIDVEIRPGGAGVNPIRSLLAGEADFAVATGDQVLLAGEEGAPIVAIGLVYRDNPLAWIVRKSGGIGDVANLKGRKIGVTFIDDGPLFGAMLRRGGLLPSDVTVVSVKFDPSPFLRKDVDAYPVFRNTQGVEIAETLSKDGEQAAFVGPADVGITSYSNLYVTLRSTVQSNPRAVQAFINGAIDGWTWAQSNEDGAATIVSRYDRENKLPTIRKSVQATNALVQGSSSLRIGEMTLADWNETKDVLAKAGQLKKDIDVNNLFDPGFAAQYYKQ